MGDNEKTHDPHDTRLKELFRNKEAFISLLKDCVKEDWLNDLDEGSLRLNPTSYILQDFNKKEADVVYEATLKNGTEKVIFYVLLELQSQVDYRMPYRLLLYIVEILRNYYNQADVNERETKNFKFPAIFPMVFYIGSQKWTVPLNLKEMFYGYGQFGEYLLNFNYALVDAKGYDNESVRDFHSRLLKIMMILEKSKGYVEILETIGEYNDEIVKLNAEEKRILGVALDIFSEIYGQTKYRLDEIIRAETAEGMSGMLVDVLANAKDYENNLRKEGEMKAERKAAQEKLEIAQKLIKRGLSVMDIAEDTGLSIAEIEKEVEKSNKS